MFQEMLWERKETIKMDLETVQWSGAQIKPANNSMDRAAGAAGFIPNSS